MSVLNQKTIKKSVKFEGVGLHSGKKVEMTLFPAQPNTGITFKRSDLKKNNIIYTSVFNVSSASYCTKLTNEYGVLLINERISIFFLITGKLDRCLRILLRMADT